MDRHGLSPRYLLPSHIRCARLVYRYEAPHCITIRDRTSLTNPTVAYALGIYLLNLFLAFLQPKFDPSNEALDSGMDMEDGSAGGLPTKHDEEFRPFIRRLPEFKFWHSATRAIAIGFLCSWFELFNVPVFWPVLVMYWIILFTLTSKFTPSRGRHVRFSTDPVYSEEADPAHDQVPICPILLRQGQVRQDQHFVGDLVALQAASRVWKLCRKRVRLVAPGCMVGLGRGWLGK